MSRQSVTNTAKAERLAGLAMYAIDQESELDLSAGLAMYAIDQESELDLLFTAAFRINKTSFEHIKIW